MKNAFLTQNIGGEILILCAVLIIWSIIICWKMFRKADQPGWAVLIPFYDVFVMNNVAKMSHVWTVFVIFCAFILIFSIPQAQTSITTPFALSIALTLSIPAFVAIFAFFLWDVILSINLAKCFHLSGWFALGIFALPVVFIAIIAFNKNIHYNFGSDFKKTALIERW